MLEKSRDAMFFQWFVCRVGRKVGLLKRRVRRYVLRGDIKNCTPLWRKTHFEVKMLKNWRSRSTFWSSDVEKLYAAVAKNTFWSESVQNTSVSEHFLKFRCRKSEKHIGKWKCTKHVGFGALFDVLRSKNCTPLWRKTHLEVKMLKNCSPRSTFWSSDVEKMHAAVAKSTFWSQNVKKLRVREHFSKFRCRQNARRCGEKHILKWKCTKHVGFGALFDVQMSKNWSVRLVS